MGMKYDYIEKDFVIYSLEHFGSMLTWNKEDTLAEIERCIKEAKPIGDVVRVVRCKDCYFRTFDDVLNEYYCDCAYGINGAITDYTFCYYGER